METTDELTNVLIPEIDNLLDDYIHSRYEDENCLGEGMYSLCVEVAGYCVKLGGYCNTDAGGEVWAKWCIDNQHLACVPKILYSRFFGDHQYILVMEILSSVEPHSTEFSRYAEYIEDDEVPYNATVPAYIQEFIEAFADIREEGYLDLHSGNYMLREEDGVMVIIDPFSGATFRR